MLVEDTPDDIELIQELLHEATSLEFRLESVERLGDALNRQDIGGIELIIPDLGLPDSQGLKTLARLQSGAPTIPIVVLTGLDDEDIGLEAVTQGAQDYLVKGVANGHL